MTVTLIAGSQRSVYLVPSVERPCKFDPALEPDMARHCSKGRPHWHDKAPALTQREAGLRLSITVAPFKFTKAAACRGTVTVTSRVVVFRDMIPVAVQVGSAVT
jgi:hypothetical protein